MANLCINFWTILKTIAVSGLVFTLLTGVAGVSMYALSYLRGQYVVFHAKSAIVLGLCASIFSAIAYPVFRICIAYHVGSIIQHSFINAIATFIHPLFDKGRMWATVNAIATFIPALFAGVMLTDATISADIETFVAAFVVALVVAIVMALGVYNLTAAYLDAKELDNLTAAYLDAKELDNLTAAYLDAKELDNLTAAYLDAKELDNVYICTFGNCSSRRVVFTDFLSYQRHTVEMAHRRL